MGFWNAKKAWKNVKKLKRKYDKYSEKQRTKSMERARSDAEYYAQKAKAEKARAQYERARSSGRPTYQNPFGGASSSLMGDFMQQRPPMQRQRQKKQRGIGGLDYL